MIFLRAEGTLENQRLGKDEIAQQIESYNLKTNKNAYYFIGRHSIKKFTAGCIFDKEQRLSVCCDEMTSFIKTVFPTADNVSVRETSYKDINTLLKAADSSEYIDRDEVLKSFGLDSFNSWRNIEFDEIIYPESDKETIYKTSSSLESNETLTKELDRIYEVNNDKGAIGHPVHYCIESDDEDVQKSICETLGAALFDNGRLLSRRLCQTDIDSDHRSSWKDIDDVEALFRSCSGGALAIRLRVDEHDGDEDEEEFASSFRDYIREAASLMKKYRNRVLTMICLPRACNSLRELIYESIGNISLVEIKEDMLSGSAARSYLEKLAREHSVDHDDILLDMVKDDDCYLPQTLKAFFNDWFDTKLRTNIYPQYKEMIHAKREVQKMQPKGSAYDELMSLIGIEEAKKMIRGALNFFKAQKLFAEKGMTQKRPSMHMVFTGNPGTAKTTVARLFAQIMKDNGLLSTGRFVEVGRGDLVGKYVGHTAPLVTKQFENASGGVLFIDEAYSLVDDKDGMFGDEAINTIVQEMENRREDVVVIFAGYPDKMEGFLNKNPGLRSRIAFKIQFADYGVKELVDITKLIADKSGLRFDDNACRKLEKVFEIAVNNPNFGNGRFARNVVEKARMAQAERLCAMDYESVTSKVLSTLIDEDIEMPAESEKAKAKVNPIGFISSEMYAERKLEKAG